MTPDIQVADMRVVQLVALLRNCEWEAILAFAEGLPKAPLAATVGVTLTVHLHLQHYFP